MNSCCLGSHVCPGENTSHFKTWTKKKPFKSIGTKPSNSRPLNRYVTNDTRNKNELCLNSDGNCLRSARQCKEGGQIDCPSKNIVDCKMPRVSWQTPRSQECLSCCLQNRHKSSGKHDIISSCKNAVQFSGSAYNKSYNSLKILFKKKKCFHSGLRDKVHQRDISSYNQFMLRYYKIQFESNTA